MKRYFSIFLLWLILRTAGVAANLGYGEWFIDGDPGRGAGTAFALPNASAASVNVTIPPAALQNLAPGFHLLGIRLSDDSGQWGHVVWRSFHKDVASQTPRRLTGAEWFIDEDPGAGMGTAFSVPDATSANISPQIPWSALQGLSDGFHLLGVRTRDDALRWGAVVWRSFHIDSAPKPAPNIVSLEYRIFQNGLLRFQATVPADPAGNPVSMSVAHGTTGLQLNETHMIQVVPIDGPGRRGHASYADFTLQTILPADLAGALDTPARTYAVGGNGNWFGQSSVTHDGVDAAQSGLTGFNEESWFETTVVGPGNISFWWKVLSEANWDFLEFYIDGVLQPGRISGSPVNWEQKNYSISSGTHVLRWRYSEDYASSPVGDGGWVDQIVWSPIGFPATAADSGLTGNDALPTATPFNDGVPNLLKYAFNMNLAGPDASTLPPGTGTSGLPSITTPDDAPPGTLRFEFLRRKGSGLIYTPQKSTTLAGIGWTPLAATPMETSINDQWERVVYVEPPAPVPADACFGRVSVSLPSP